MSDGNAASDLLVVTRDQALSQKEAQNRVAQAWVGVRNGSQFGMSEVIEPSYELTL